MASSRKILVTERYHPSAVAYLRQNLDCKIVDTPSNKEPVDGALIRSKTKVTDAWLNDSPKIQAVITATSGFDHIDIPECLNRNIYVDYTPGANCESAAQLVMALILCHARQLPLAFEHMRTGLWRDNLNRGVELGQQSLGIIGFGRIGCRVAALAQAFGMSVCAHDPYVDEDEFNKRNVEPLGLSEIFRASDYLSLHTPLTQETYHLINHQTLNAINPDTVLINAARGAIVEETELAEALEANRLRGAILDVFESEPLDHNSRFNRIPQALTTPHIGAYTQAAWERSSLQAAQKMVAFFKKESTESEIPTSAPWFEHWVRMMQDSNGG